MDSNYTSLNDQLSALRKTLPRGSTFDYDLSEGLLYLKALAIPKSERGVGRSFMEKVLQLCDLNETTVTLHAHGRGLKGDMDTSGLVRWYSSLGFESLDLEDEGMFMQRSFVAISSNFYKDKNNAQPFPSRVGLKI